MDQKMFSRKIVEKLFVKNLLPSSVPVSVSSFTELSLPQLNSPKIAQKGFLLEFGAWWEVCLDLDCSAQQWKIVCLLLIVVEKKLFVLNYLLCC